MAGLATGACVNNTRNTPSVKAKLVVQGLYPVARCGAEFGALLRKEVDDYGRVIREANIKAE